MLLYRSVLYIEAIAITIIYNRFANVFGKITVSLFRKFR